MVDVTYTILLLIPTIGLLVVTLVMPIYFSRQNKKSLEAIVANQELIRIQLEADRKREQDKKLFALTLQAYERVSLFMERINPVNIIPRLLQPGQTAVKLESLIVNSIREEYEHNMSQQLYISDTAWKLVKSAKEDIIKLVGTAATKVDKNATGSDLAKEILTSGYDNEIKNLDAALAGLKKELRSNF